MDFKAAVNQLLGGLAARVGATGLCLSNEGTCGFDYKDRMSVVIELPDQSPLVHIYAPIMAIPEHHQERLFRRLLRLNLFCHATNGATLAISEEHNQVILCYRHPVGGLDQVLFETILENFLVVLERTRHELDETNDDDRTASNSSLIPRDYLKA